MHSHFLSGVLGLGVLSLLLASPAPAQGATPFASVVIDPVMGFERYNEKALADVNGNGLLDIIARNGEDGVVWYRNPDWTAFELSDWPDGGEEGLAGDVDGDGDTDFVASGRADREPVWYENPASEGADLTKTPWIVHELGAYGSKASHDLELADIDHNGRLDIVMYGGILFQVGNDVWTFKDASSILPGRGYLGTGSGDIDGDGDVDIVGSDSADDVAWWENPLPAKDPKTNAWVRRVIGPGWRGTASQVGDLNGDGRRDIVAAPYDSTGGLFWFTAPANPKAAGAVWVQKSIDPAISHVHDGSIHIRDFDLDGTPDILVSEQEQSAGDTLSIYENNGLGSFTRNLIATTAGFNTKVGDVDRDGDIDILNAPSGFYGADNPLILWLNLPEPGSSAGLATGLLLLALLARRRR